jgi:2-phospho-L-lactate/phosphoenolpyruvate guanylyltransferase
LTRESRWAVLPVKAFDWAKSRLDGVLAPAERSSLARRLMLRSLDALLESGCFDRVVVVSRDAEALALAQERGAVPLTEDAPADLNLAIVCARQLAVSRGAASLLVLASDLPLVQADDLRRIVEASGRASAVIVPDRRAEGTNALLLTPPDLIEPAFGVGSFQRHMELLSGAGATVSVLRLKGVAFDVDVPEDLAELEGGAGGPVGLTT